MRIAMSAAAMALAVLAPAAGAAPLSNITAIAAGSAHTCVLTTAGGVKCWGDNYWGQLGDGTTTNRSTAVDVSGLASGATAIATGGYNTCALTSGGGVKCWGAGAINSPTPVDVPGLAGGVVAITAERDGDNMCVLLSAGGAKCWGTENLHGQLGDGTTTARFSPVDVTVVSPRLAAIGIGTHACALSTAGGMKCWGDNTRGQLGDGTTTGRVMAADVAGLASGVVAIEIVGGRSCAITSGGGAKCWGENSIGQIGDGTATVNRSMPVDVSGLSSGVASISASFNHTCAVTSGGAAKCWGSGAHGRVGDGSTTTRLTPTAVSGLATGVAAIVAGGAHSCALISGGEVRCWGANHFGQLGNGTFDTPQLLPASVGVFVPQTIAFGAIANREVDNGPFTVSATASSGLQVAFNSLTTSVCTVSGSTVTTVAIGVCSVAAHQSGNGDYAAAPQVVRSFRAIGSPLGAPARLGNISTRMQVLTGNDVLIGGFIISGSASKTVVVRGRGPSLRSAGVSNALANPALRLFSGQSVIASNDDWQGGSSAAMLQSIGLAPADVLESAILVTLAPGPYTAIVDGADGATGVGIVEVFEIDRVDAPLINISTRGRVLTGEDVMIAGWVIEGTSPQTVVVRARGPSLAAFGLTDLLANPMLQLVRSSDQVQIAVNDDWGTASNAAELSASGFAPSNAQEAAILITLNPGAYTAIVTGSGGGTGVAIVEVFKQ